jgi:hypothetical protein
MKRICRISTYKETVRITGEKVKITDIVKLR